MIRKHFGCLLAFAALSLASSVPAFAQDGRTKFIDPADVPAPSMGDNLSFTLRTGLYSDYEYRGLLLYKGTSIQPSAGAFYSLGDWGTIGASLWMHISAENDGEPISTFDANGNLFEFDRNPKFFELDPTVSYDYTYDVATFSVGHIWYTDPGEGEERFVINGEDVGGGEVAPDTSEVYVGLSLDLPGQPQFTAYWDYRELEYQYYTLSLSHTLKPEAMGDGFNLTPFVTFGFASNANDDITIYNSNGLVHVNVGISTALKLGVMQVKPNATYVFGTDDEVNGVERTVDKFFFGVDFAYDFSV